MVIHVDN